MDYYDLLGQVEAEAVVFSHEEQSVNVYTQVNPWKLAYTSEFLGNNETTDGDIEIVREFQELVDDDEDSSKVGKDQVDSDKENQSEIMDYDQDEDEHEISDDSMDSQDEDENENDEDEDEIESRAYQMGPMKRATLPLSVPEFSKELMSVLDESHRSGQPIGKYYSRMAVNELVKHIRESGIGHGLNYAEFYGPFEIRYPALVHNFTPYSKKQIERARGNKSMKKCAYRIAVRNKLSKKKRKSRRKTMEASLLAGDLPNAKISTVCHSVPTRSNGVCEEALDDFKDATGETLLWIEGFDNRTLVFKSQETLDSMVGRQDNLLDWNRIRWELQLVLGLVKYEKLFDNASVFLGQCKRVEKESGGSSFDALSRLVDRFQTKITKQKSVVFIRANGDVTVSNDDPVMVIREYLNSAEGIKADVFVLKQLVKHVSNFSEALISFIVLHVLMEIKFSTSSNQLLKFITEFVFGWLGAIKVFRKGGKEEVFAKTRKDYFFKMATY